MRGGSVTDVERRRTQHPSQSPPPHCWTVAEPHHPTQNLSSPGSDRMEKLPVCVPWGEQFGSGYFVPLSPRALMVTKDWRFVWRSPCPSATSTATEPTDGPRWPQQACSFVAVEENMHNNARITGHKTKDRWTLLDLIGDNEKGYLYMQYYHLLLAVHLEFHAPPVFQLSAGLWKVIANFLPYCKPWTATLVRHSSRLSTAVLKRTMDDGGPSFVRDACCGLV